MQSQNQKMQLQTSKLLTKVLERSKSRSGLKMQILLGKRSKQPKLHLEYSLENLEKLVNSLGKEDMQKLLIFHQRLTFALFLEEQQHE